MTYSFSNSFSNINILSVSVTSVFFKAACYANQETEKKCTGPKDKILNVFFWRFRKNQPKVLYHF